MNIQLQKFVNGRNLARFPKIKEVFFFYCTINVPLKREILGSFTGVAMCAVG